MTSNGLQPPGDAEKSLGEIVTEVTQKAQLLVREEIEHAKAEVTAKGKRLASGAIFFVIAGVLGAYLLLFVLHFLALGIADWTGLKNWVGYAIVSVALLVVIGVLALLGLRQLKKGTPPTPELAIEEAKRTREALEEARS